MTRTCSDATRRKVATLRFTKDTPGWLRAAVSNTRNGSPMSEKQELRMIEALGIASPKRLARRFYRPCLSVELGEAIRDAGVDVEESLWLFVKWTNEMNEAEAKRGMVGYEELPQEFEL